MVPIRLTRLLAVVLVICPLVKPTACHAVSYIKPDENKELFKLEKIPLQVNRMKELSGHLIVLARRNHTEDAIDQRASAQMIALALRLDPSSQDARETNREMANGNTYLKSDPEKITKAKARIRFFKRWLAHPDAGTDANNLSDFLTDSTKVLDPKTRENQDLGNWNNAIPAITDYIKKAPTTVAKKQPDTPQPQKTNPPTPQKASAFHFPKIDIHAPLRLTKVVQYNDTDSVGKIIKKTRTDVTHDITKVELTIKRGGHHNKHHFVIPGAPINQSLHKHITSTITQTVLSKHSSLPAHTFTTAFDGWNYAASNRSSLSAILAIALESSITNTPLHSDLHICAGFNSKGEFHAQANFWQSLEALRKNQKGGRLIIPKSASSLATQILVFEEPDFFTRWEVFAVDTLDEAMAVAAKQNAPDLKEADELFKSIQNLTQKTAITKLAVNRAVRTRLSQISKLSPNHFSSRVILLQGSGKRPIRLSEEALANTLLPIITKMRKPLSSTNTPGRSSMGTMKKHHEEARAALDPLERLVDRSQNELYIETLELANDFRSLFTLIRRAYDRDNSSSRATSKIKPQYTAMALKSKALLNKIRIAAGKTPLE